MNKKLEATVFVLFVCFFVGDFLQKLCSICIKTCHSWNLSALSFKGEDILFLREPLSTTMLYVCKQRRLRRDCASAQTHLSVHLLPMRWVQKSQFLGWYINNIPRVSIENTRWVSFDIKFTRQGFENACWHREACRAIQHAFSKPSLVNLISKDANLVFYLSVYPLLKTLRTSDYDVTFDVCVDSASIATSFKKCNVIMTS